MALVTRFVTIKSRNRRQPAGCSLFVIRTVCSIMQICNIALNTCWPACVGIELSRPRLIWISRKEGDIGGNLAVLFSYICPLNFFARIGEKRLSRSRICLLFRTLAKRFLIRQALSVIRLRTIQAICGSQSILET